MKLSGGWGLAALTALGIHAVAGAELPTPTHHWTFDRNSTDTISGIVGQLRGSVEYSTTDHIQGTAALRFNCCDGKVVFNDARLKDSFTNYTVALWFKMDQIVPQRFRYLYEEGGASNGFAVRIVGSRVEVAALEGGGRNVKKVSVGNIKAKQWHHVVATYSNGLISVFLDAKPGNNSLETGYGQFVAHANEASIGAGGLVHQTTALSLAGSIDDLRIWDGIALSSLEVTTLYARSLAVDAASSTPSSEPSVAPTDAPSRNVKPPRRRPNFLLIVADDLNFDSVGFMGGVAPNVTPNIDRLARESHVFTKTHSASSVCQPSRQAMLSGKYPPNYGSVGFNPMAVGTRTVVSNLSDEGYLTATFHKFWHMKPFSSFPWTMTEDTINIRGRTGNKRIGRAPTLLAEATRMAIAAAQKAKTPFFVVVNSADTHRPFPGDGVSIDSFEMVEEPSRIYRPHEVTLPSPITDLPVARTDFAQYASSVRRLDDTVGRCLQVLEETGMANNTVVMFLSDNGMPMPFGKFDTYRDSIRTPLIIRWPGVLAPTMDQNSLVSLTDVAPTLIEMADAPPLLNIDGRSLMPLMIANEPDLLAWRNVVVGTRYEDIYYSQYIFTERQRNDLRAEGWVDAGGSHDPGTLKRTMHKRGITDGVFHYIYNHFYNATHPKQTYAYPYDGGVIVKAMEQAAANGNGTIADRLEFYRYRAQEEFYNISSDPGSEQNLMGQGSVRSEIRQLQLDLLAWMFRTNDPVASDYAAFLHVENQ